MENRFKPSQKLSYSDKKVLRVVPLGGLGEIGRNMTILEYGNDLIIIDAGLMFPTEEMLGIDFVIPDISYIQRRRQKLRGLIVTHAHEDHFGGIPYLWPKISCPIYTARFTAAMIEARFKEFNLKKPQIRHIKPFQKFRLGIFEIEPFPLSHTVPDELGLIINTPLGKLAYVADFRFDYENPQEKKIFAYLAQKGQEKIFCLFSDSTNAEIEGQSVSEVKIKETIDSIIKKAPGRVIVTSFASSLPRIQSVFDAAQRYNRRIAISGRSMKHTVDIGLRLGYLKIPPYFLIRNIREINKLDKRKIIILCTGSQGEEYAALVRMAAGEHKQVKIEPGDIVIISASAVPGNERAIAKTIDNLFREGAEVIYGGEEAEIHASGHAKSEDLKLMINLLKPRYFIPIHGEYRHLVRHSQLASSMGVPHKNIFVIENGEIVEFDKNGGRIIKEKAPAGYVLVDGLGVGDVGNIVLRDRHVMASDGIFIVILTVDAKTGKVLTSPDIISRGFVYMRESEELIQRTREEALKCLEARDKKYPANWNFIKNKIRDHIGEFLYKQTQRRPMVIPVIIEV